MTSRNARLAYPRDIDVSPLSANISTYYAETLSFLLFFVC